MMQHIRPAQLARWLQSGDGREPPPVVLDVRDAWETQLCSLPDSLHIPMQQIPARLAEIDAQRPVVCLCHHGMRSMQVAAYLASNGVREVYNLAGGIDAWAREIDPSCATY